MTPAAGVLRIATYNVLHGIDLADGMVALDRVAATIRAWDVDAVAVQEVDRALQRSGGHDQAAWLADALGWQHAFAPALRGNPDRAWRALDGDDPGGPAYGVALLARLPLDGVRRVRLPGGGDGRRRPGATPSRPGWDREPRVALTARLRVDGRPVQVTTTHLSYLPWRAVPQLRAALAATVRAAGPHPALLLGDLNLPRWGTRLASGRPWRHAGGGPTYPVPAPRLQPDQLLLRGPVAVTALQVGPAGTSDHLPVRATLRLHPEGRGPAG